MKYIDDIQTDWVWGNIQFFILFFICLLYVHLFVKLKDDRNIDNDFTSFFKRWQFPCLAFLGLSLPIHSADLFAYLEFPRLFIFHELNPYLNGYSQVQDNYSTFSWFGRTTNYGPLAHLLALPAAIVSQSSVYIALFLLKATFVCIGFFCISLARKIFAQKDFILFVANPFFIIEIFFNSHNDAFAVLLILIYIFAIKSHHHHYAILALASLSLFKLPLGIIAFLSFLYFFFARSYKLSLHILLSQFVVIIIYYSFMGLEGLKQFLKGSSPYTEHSFFGHFITVFEQFFLREKPLIQDWTFSTQIILRSVSTVLLLSILIWFILKARKSWINETKETQMIENSNMLDQITFVFIVFVYIIATQFWPWYALWILPFVNITRQYRTKQLFLICSLSSLILYSPLYWRSLKPYPEEYIMISVFKIFIITLPVLTTIFAFSQYYLSKSEDHANEKLHRI